MTDLLDAARRWIADDPDPETRAELTGLMSEGALQELEARFESELTFGTAGIRAEVAAGPARMNRAVVIRTTYGLAKHLHDNGLNGIVVVGFDARPSSRVFAADVIGVLAASGIEVRFFPDVTPTPIVAFAAKDLGADSAVVITASHNPPRDNGYKVYGPTASQIVSPTDFEIQQAIETAPGAMSIPRLEDVFEGGHSNIRALGPEVLDRYWGEVDESRRHRDGSDLGIVYTPLHGVGGASLLDLMERAGHRRVRPVTAQFEPDGTFPTVAFPNPEEPGALDLALELAKAGDADLIIANDPDADRLAVAIPDRGSWRSLTGNEIGMLLADYLLNADLGFTPIVASSIVSSPMLDSIANLYSATRATTLTGFKWITAAALALEAAGEGVFLFGYEEALGYCVGRTVRDKDGLSASVVFADMTAHLAATGSSIGHRLGELWETHGLWVSTQVSVRRDGAEGSAEISEAIARLADDPPSALEGVSVQTVTDYRIGEEDRPPWLGAQDLVELRVERGRLLVRPSGTEPKMKIYVDLSEPFDPDDDGQRPRLLGHADALGNALAAHMGM